MWIPGKIFLAITPMLILEVVVYGFFGAVITETVKLFIDWCKEKMDKE